MSIFYSIRRTMSSPYRLPLSTSSLWFLGTYLRVIGRRLKMKMGMYDSLTRLASEYDTDKGVICYPFHAYTLHYSRFFERFAGREVNILEIGLSRKRSRSGQDSGESCPSLELWVNYFPKANIYGLDIDDFSRVVLPRTKIFRGDQGNIQDLEQILSECPNFDIIIDDGSHASYHQKVSLEVLFPHLNKGGLYIIEDMHHQPIALEKTLPSTEKMKNILRNRNALEALIGDFSSVELFDSNDVYGKDALGIISKN